MYCAALSTGIRLLVKCFTRPPVSPTPPPIPTPQYPSKLSTSIESLVKLKSNTELSEVSNADVYKHDFIGGTFGKAAAKSMGTSMGRADGRTQAAKPVVVASNVTCRVRGNLLETRNKVLKTIQVTNPIMAPKSVEEVELKELVEKVRRMYEELERSKNEVKISNRIPAYVEPGFEEFDQEETDIQPTQKLQHHSFQPQWMEITEVVEIATSVTRCDDMTVEGVDEVLRDINIRMNAMVAERAKTIEEQNKWMDEVGEKMKEYAEVLLDSPCEVQLAIERARVRAVGLRRASDAAYLISLSPGSFHVPGCDLACLENYLPRRATETGYPESEPGLSSGSTSPSLSSAPSTPQSFSTELPQAESINNLIKRLSEDNDFGECPVQNDLNVEQKRMSMCGLTSVRKVVAESEWR
ncbi:hypothetical protein RhiJN_00247 [Ceratobasidium sp. AG-Ba]|nr:hypothetical protein RhiJN_00247 [Ceratobasidium sp. AG-Ba]